MTFVTPTEFNFHLQMPLRQRHGEKYEVKLHCRNGIMLLGCKPDRTVTSSFWWDFIVTVKPLSCIETFFLMCYQFTVQEKLHTTRCSF
jgi:hypothetical protein